MTAHDIHALSGAYALDALDDLERARFEAHLSACAECQAEVASLHDAAALFSTVTEVAPPAAMRGRILSEIKTVRPLPPVVARLGTRRPRRWAAGVVAAAVVLGILGGGVVVWRQSTGSSTATLSAADRIKAAADVTTFTKDLGKGASVRIYRSASLGKAAMVTSHLPAAPSGKVYQLWLRDTAGHMVSAGLLTGSGHREVVLQGDAGHATGAGITVEPAGGSATPTIPVFAIIDFQQAT